MGIAGSGSQYCKSCGTTTREDVLPEQVRRCVIFFFKQKTAYEMLRSLVGSEMCIRDRRARPLAPPAPLRRRSPRAHRADRRHRHPRARAPCLLYTSDAADDLPCVDLGGRRLIKKTNNHSNRYTTCLLRLTLPTHNHSTVPRATPADCEHV